MPKQSRTPRHPGTILQNELTQAGLNAQKLATALKIPVDRVIQILRGERDITPDTALRLARFFGIPAEEWLRLQSQYGLACAETAEIERDVMPLVRDKPTAG
jgi:addiction module HigA family antidote